MATVILGWGSLIWDDPPGFNAWHGEWQAGGPDLKLEFSRVSENRLNALTLVIDPVDGAACTVRYAVSKRRHFVDVVADLRCREGCNWNKIGRMENPAALSTPRPTEAEEAIRAWAVRRGFDGVVWTALESNFGAKSDPRAAFSVPTALAHLRNLKPEAKVKAAEYIWRAPDFADTPLRRAVQVGPWF